MRGLPVELWCGRFRTLLLTSESVSEAIPQHAAAHAALLGVSDGLHVKVMRVLYVFDLDYSALKFGYIDKRANTLQENVDGVSDQSSGTTEDQHSNHDANCRMCLVSSGEQHNGGS